MMNLNGWERLNQALAFSVSERYVHLPGFTSRTLTSLFWWGNTIPNAPELYSASFELPLPDVCYTTNQLLRTLALWTKISIYDVSDNSEKTLFPTSIWATRKIPVFPRGQSKFRRTLTSHSSVAPLQQILEWLALQ